MSLSLITAENLRDPLPGILDTLVERHIAHRLVDDFLILTPDEVSASDVESALLSDPRLGGVLTGESVLPLPAWISSLVREMEPRALSAPAWALQALFDSLAKKSSALALGERISVSSLFQLVTSFREELRNLDSLRAFVQDLDPDFADEAVRLAREYADRIDALPSCKDFAWRASRVLEGVEKGGIPTLKKIRTFYWLGFPLATPLLKALTERIQAAFPETEQILHIQMPKGLDPQDWSSRFEVQNTLHHFKALAPSKPTSAFQEFPGPFDEAGSILTRIHRLCEEGEVPSRIGLFLPSDPFWESYFSSELAKMGLKLSETRRRPLSSFPPIAETLSLQPEAALQKVKDLLKATGKEWPVHSKDPPQAASFALLSRALRQWEEVLQQILFYRTEVPELQDSLPSLFRIASVSELKERSLEEGGVALRSHRKAGLRSFSQAFLFGLTERALPLNPERFFGRILPDSNRDLEAERARFQHLLGASGLNLSLSYSVHSPQTEEIAPTPFLLEWGWENPEKTRHPPLFGSRHLREDFQKRREIELKRQHDFSYRHPHGGWIQDPELIQALQARLEEHCFTPAQLQAFSDCPFKFFASTLLRLKAPDEKEWEGTAAERGSWVHNFLEDFFSKNRARILKAAQEPQEREKILEAVEPSLKEISQEFLKERPWIHPTLSADHMGRTAAMTKQLLEKTWQVMSLSRRPFLPTHFEMEFGKDPNKPFLLRSPSGKAMQLRGRIDRIDATEDGQEFLVLDYKTGEAKDLSRRIREWKGLQLPLYLVAARRLLEGAQGVGALILGLKEMNGSEGMLKKGEKARLGFKGRSALYEEEEWEGYWPQLETRLFELLERMNSGDFRTDPNPCDPFCDFKNLCRYHDREKNNR